MSNYSSSNMKSAKDWVSLLAHLEVKALKNLKVSIKRHDISGRKGKSSYTDTDQDIQRKLEKPEELVVHLRSDEGNRPLFDRDDIIVNKINCYEERVIVQSKKRRSSSSRSKSSSPDNYSNRRRRKSRSNDSKRDRESPISHRHKYRRRSRSSETRKSAPSTSRSRNYSPSYDKRKDYRKRSPERTINFTQTRPPDKYRKESRSPHRSDDYRRHRSRSPDYRHYRSHSSKHELAPYYESGDEYWYAGPPTLPPFLPRQYMPPGGGFPRPILMPRLPPSMLMAPPMPFRPPLPRLPIYNQKLIKQKCVPTVTTVASVVKSSVTSIATTATSVATSSVTSTVTLPSVEISQVNEEEEDKAKEDSQTNK